MVTSGKTLGSRTFDAVNITFMVVLSLIYIYPLLYVLFASLSDASSLISHNGVLFRPLGFNLQGYKMVLMDKGIAIGYLNTIFYVVVGTSVNIALTSMGAYVLSRKKFIFKKFLSIMIVMSMYFSGGLIPFFLLVKGLGLYDSRFALIIPVAINTWNMIIMRTSFSQLPEGLEESARIDGANDFTILCRIILPVSQAVLAVMILFYAVQHWNSWFNALIFLRKRSYYPLQLLLREILVENTIKTNMEFSGSAEDILNKSLIKYCTIIVSTVPILAIYPFLQKYFAKGVMVGSLKG